jgi:hypothetical protein
MQALSSALIVNILKKLYATNANIKIKSMAKVFIGCRNPSLIDVHAKE